MPFLAGGFANVGGYSVGPSLFVECLASRDSAGVPRWQLCCRYCLRRQILGHARVTAALEAKLGLPCSNPRCPSRRDQTESFAEFNRRMRQEKEQAAKAEQEAKLTAEREAAERRSKEAQAEALKGEYREFFTHQMLSAGVFDELIPRFERWIRLPREDRARIMSAIRQRPDVRVEID